MKRYQQGILAMLLGLTTSCHDLFTPPPAPGNYVNGLLWLTPKSLYVQTSGSKGTRYYRWDLESGVKSVSGPAGDVQLVAARDNEVLLLDQKSQQYQLFNPQQARLTPLPLRYPATQPLGWDKQGRLIVMRQTGNCPEDIVATATGSDSGPVLIAGPARQALLAPTGDAIAFQPNYGGTVVQPIAAGGPAGLVLGARQFSWATRRRLLVMTPSYRWALIDPTSGRSEAFPGETAHRFSVSPDDGLMAYTTYHHLTILGADGTSTRAVVPIKDLP